MWRQVPSRPLMRGDPTLLTMREQGQGSNQSGALPQVRRGRSGRGLLEPVADAVVVGAGALCVPGVGQGSVLALGGLVLVLRPLVVRPAAYPGGVVDAVVGGVGGRQGCRGCGRCAEQNTGESNGDGRADKTCAQRNPPLRRTNATGVYSGIGDLAPFPASQDTDRGDGPDGDADGLAGAERGVGGAWTGRHTGAEGSSWSRSVNGAARTGTLYRKGTNSRAAARRVLIRISMPAGPVPLRTNRSRGKSG